MEKRGFLCLSLRNEMGKKKICNLMGHQKVDISAELETLAFFKFEPRRWMEKKFPRTQFL